MLFFLGSHHIFAFILLLLLLLPALTFSSNPKVIAALKDVMSNPASIAKYAQDPEIAAVLQEFRGLLK